MTLNQWREFCAGNMLWFGGFSYDTVQNILKDWENDKRVVPGVVSCRVCGDGIEKDGLCARCADISVRDQSWCKRWNLQPVGATE